MPDLPTFSDISASTSSITLTWMNELLPFGLVILSLVVVAGVIGIFYKLFVN